MRDSDDDATLVAAAHGRSRRARPTAASPLRPRARGLPAHRRRRPRRRRRRTGGDDQHRARPRRGSMAARRSRRGSTASPPTLRSTSCAAGAGGRRRTWSTTTPRGPTSVDPLAERRVDAAALRLAIDDALDDLPEEFRAPSCCATSPTSTTPRSPRCCRSRSAPSSRGSPAAVPSSPRQLGNHDRRRDVKHHRPLPRHHRPP